MSNQKVSAHEPIEFLSTDGTTTCKGDLWLPAGTPRAYVQIVHGMVEYIGCYRHMAERLTAAGFAVAGIDQLGHGRTTPDPARRGVYDHKQAAYQIVEDQHLLRGLVERRLGAQVPTFVLGHSMGSFVTRCYIDRHGEGLAGAIIMGTGWQPGYMLGMTRFLTSAIALFHGWDYRSRFIDNLGVGGYNKAFEGTGAKTGYEWLSRDEARPVAYAKDPDCGWTFSLSGYYMIAGLLGEAESPERIAAVPKALPVLILSGADDPVGVRGAGPTTAYEAYRKAGLTDVTLHLYEGARHELQNETCKDAVFAEIVDWVGSRAAR